MHGRMCDGKRARRENGRRVYLRAVALFAAGGASVIGAERWLWYLATA